jgi:hypothetical protein
MLPRGMALEPFGLQLAGSKPSRSVTVITKREIWEF